MARTGRPALPLAGKKFNRLTAMERVPHPSGAGAGKHAYWKFKCDCGNEVALAGSAVSRGAQKSCGCFEWRNDACLACDKPMSRYTTAQMLYCRPCGQIAGKIKSLGVAMSVVDYRSMMRDAAGVCQACGGKADRPVLDHNHQTGEPRGVLCRACNVTEGYFKNDYTRLLRLYEYCVKHASASQVVQP